MTNDMTGPAHYRESNRLANQAQHYTYGDGADPVTGNALATEALVHAVNAQTAAITLLTETVATATGVGAYELDAWREVIPQPPLKECKGKHTRRPACEERHTEDCDYADPPPEPKHELLDVGTRVLVSDWVRDEDHYGEGYKVRLKNPQPGRISGYDMHRAKYRWQYEFEPGIYAKHDSWAFVDNRVEVHPDGPECPAPPKLVKREPTGPRVYVQTVGGAQGYVVDTKTDPKRGPRLRVHWLQPGGPETWALLSEVGIIMTDEVQRCDNGQDGEECTEIGPCEPCQQDADAEGDAIEESMGLR